MKSEALKLIRKKEMGVLCYPVLTTMPNVVIRRWGGRRITTVEGIILISFLERSCICTQQVELDEQEDGLFGIFVCKTVFSIHSRILGTTRTDSFINHACKSLSVRVIFSSKNIIENTMIWPRCLTGNYSLPT